LSPRSVAKHVCPVLCVEDDSPTRKALVKILAARFERVLVARDGDEGLELFLQHQPSLVITDIKMPRMDGIAMAREMRALNPATKIIVITSYGSQDLLLAAIETGVTEYIMKPLSAERVYAAIDKCLRVIVLEQQVKEANAQTHHVLESIRDVFFALDQDWRLTYVNLKAESYFNRPRPEILGRPLQDLLPGPEPIPELYQDAMRGQEMRSFEYYTPRLDAWHEARVFPLDGGISVYLRDITEQKKAQEEMRFLAFYDKLTGLPNRTLLQDRLYQAISRCRRDGRQGAVLFMDLDRFKNINDSLGHDTGDRVLQEAARRLKVCIREGDTVARLGGDEFIVLLDSIDHPEHIHWVTDRIRNALAQDIQQHGVQLSLTASIGISLIPADGETMEDLLKAADTAMYYSKKRGGNAYHFYHPEMNARTQNLLILENTLRKSFQNRDFTLVFQPQHDLRSRALLGFEALLRWNHPTLGLVPPTEFIPIAEETGLILPLGEWVLETACRQGRTWMEDHGRLLRMAVNVSSGSSGRATWWPPSRGCWPPPTSPRPSWSSSSPRAWS